MTRGPLGVPRPMASSEIVMVVSISKGSLNKIREGKRDVNQMEVAEIESLLRQKVMKSFATGPADQRIDVERVGKGKVRIWLGDKVGSRQISDIERVMKNAGFKIANYQLECK